MRPQLYSTETNKRRITKRKEDTNLIRKNCKEIWKYISVCEEAGKDWSIWFPISMNNNRIRWVLGTRKSTADSDEPLSLREWKHTSILVTQWRQFYTRHYKGERHDKLKVIRQVKDHLTYILESGYPIYNERLVKLNLTIGSQCSMFCWTHDTKGSVYWNTLFDDDSPNGTGKPANQVYESFMNAVMSDTLDHAL